MEMCTSKGMELTEPPRSVATEGEFQREGEVYFVFKIVLKLTGGQKWSVNPNHAAATEHVQQYGVREGHQMGKKGPGDEQSERLKGLKLGHNRTRFAFGKASLVASLKTGYGE